MNTSLFCNIRSVYSGSIPFRRKIYLKMKHNLRLPSKFQLQKKSTVPRVLWFFSLSELKISGFFVPGKNPIITYGAVIITHQKSNVEIKSKKREEIQVKIKKIP